MAWLQTTLTSTQRSLLVLAVTTVFATSFSVSVIYLSDLLVPGFTARFDNYAFATLIPLAASPLLIYPMLILHQRMERAQTALEHMARTDALTGVANRRGFFEAAQAAFASSREPVALLMVDIDHFKRVNDLHGHAAGDELLRRTAQMIGTTVSDVSGVVGRIGGEEFAVLLAGVSRPAVAVIAEKLCRRARAGRFVHHGQSIGATLSVGVAFRCPGEEVDAVMRAADLSAYAAKRAGRDRWSFAEERKFEAPEAAAVASQAA